LQVKHQEARLGPEWHADIIRCRRWQPAPPISAIVVGAKGAGLYEKPEPTGAAGPDIRILHWAGSREIALAKTGVEKSELIGTRQLGHDLSCDLDTPSEPGTLGRCSPGRVRQT